MLLSRKWSADLGGWIQMDWTYSTVPASEDSLVRLHREKERKHHVEDPKKPSNEYVYNTDEIESYTCYSSFLAPIKEKIKDERVDVIRRMNFDGAHSRAGKEAGIVITSPSGQIFNFASKLEFEATNNVAEYEALLLGVEIAKDMGIKILSIKGDSYLGILHIKNEYACNCKRLKKYRNGVWDIMEFFDALNLIAIPKYQNSMANNLGVAASTLEPSKELLNGNEKLEINFSSG